MYLLSNMAILGIQPLVFGSTLVKRRFFFQVGSWDVEDPEFDKKTTANLV